MNENKVAELVRGLLSVDPAVMRDPVPFKVLLLVANGIDNPKSIADALGVKPPSVIYQLRRLKQVDFAKLGDKEGKIQHYRVDWGGLIEAFSKVASCAENFEEVSENLYFTTILKEAFTAAGRFAAKCSPEVRIRRLRRWRTSLKDFFYQFRIALIKSYPELRREKPEDPQLISLRNMLDECNKKCRKYYGTRGDLFWRIAFEEVGIVEKKFSSLF